MKTEMLTEDLIEDKNEILLKEAEVTSTPTRPVENDGITTKGLQGQKQPTVIDGRTVENKGK